MMDNPIIISNFFAQHLAGFKTISTNTSIQGIGNIIQRNYPQCNICLMEIKPY